MQSVYDSALHHPGIAWLGGLVFALFLARSPLIRDRKSLGIALAIGTLVSVLDAYFTGALSPLPTPSRLATVASIVFVILGDARFFVLVSAADRGSLRAVSHPMVLGKGLAMALVIPLLTAALSRVFPGPFADLRVFFLVYELLFFLYAALCFPWRKGGYRSPGMRGFVRRLVAFELAQYGLWVACDVALLAHFEGAILLRIVPNALYYAAFLPFVFALARRVDDSPATDEPAPS